MSIKRLFDAVERRGDIGRRIAALVLPISNRPRVTSSCAGKIGLRKPGEHTSGPNLASRDNVAHSQNLYTILWSGPAASIGWNASPAGVSERPLGGGRAKIENSSRRHPRKFGQKRFLAARRSWRGNGVACFWATSCAKVFRRRHRDHLVQPRRTDAAVCRADVCYPFGREHGRHRAMKRREFITLLGSAAAAWPLAARAEQAVRNARIGCLIPGTRDSHSRFVAGFRERLSQLGYVENRNLVLDLRWAEGKLDRFPALASELAFLTPDVVVVAIAAGGR